MISIYCHGECVQNIKHFEFSLRILSPIPPLPRRIERSATMAADKEPRIEDLRRIILLKALKLSHRHLYRYTHRKNPPVTHAISQAQPHQELASSSTGSSKRQTGHVLCTFSHGRIQLGWKACWHGSSLHRSPGSYFSWQTGQSR